MGVGSLAWLAGWMDGVLEITTYLLFCVGRWMALRVRMGGLEMDGVF